MFDGMFGSKVSNKCKQAVKCIRVRAAPIRKKKQATVAYLRRVVADLLAKGLEDDAFGRIDALFVETNHTSCYDMIETFCEFILSQLPSLLKQRESSQEVIEAMGTLVFAAARFPDLPELCDLRHVFTERYGVHIESSLNVEFVEKFQKRVFSKEKKLELMQNIADEFSVRWDSKSFGHKQSNPPTAKFDELKKVVPSQNGDKPSSTKTNELKEEIPFKEKLQATSESVVRRPQRLMEPKGICVTSTTGNGHSQGLEKTRKPVNIELESISNPPFENTMINNNIICNDELKDRLRNRTRKVEDELHTTGRTPDQQGSRVKYWRDMAPPYTKPDGTRNVCDVEQIKGHGIAPYIKSDASTNANPVKERNMNGLEHNIVLRHEEGLAPPVQERQPVRPPNNNGRGTNLIPPYVRPRTNNLSVHDGQTYQNSDAADFHKSNDTKDGYRQKDLPLGDERRKPVSVRRASRQLPDINDNSNGIIDEKLSSHTPGDPRGHTSRQASRGYDDDNSEIKIPNKGWKKALEEEVDNAIVYGKLFPRTSSDQRKHGSRREYDEEEVVMDRLLRHYSRKGKATGTGKERGKNRNHMVHAVATDEVVEEQGNGIPFYGKKESKHPPPERALSLPPESVSTAVPVAPPRANSMQPDLFSPNAGGRVHPRMPDYDQLATRLAALRRTR